MAEQVRVRFPPSPTGLLHVGSARTALYNWLFARHHGGVFVFRIEDTDVARSTPEHAEQAMRVLRWLGIEWDEGPFRQSERIGLYHEVVERLLMEGKAYRCYCTPQELDAERERRRAANLPLVYSGRCRNLTDAERAAFEAEGRLPAIRLRVPETGETVFEDIVRGTVRVPNETVGDHVIVRSDGAPTYQFANPVDDIDNRITHIVRGEDLLSSTPRQLALYDAVGARRPIYAHLPMILGPDGKRLSKRHGATSVEEFQSRGYLPDALCNYVALLGWSYDERTTVMTRDELVERFTLERVGRSPATFDYQKLEWMNGEHLRMLPAGAYADALLAHLRTVGSPLAPQEARVREVVPAVQEKLRELGQFEGFAGFLFGPVLMEEDAWARIDGSPEAERALAAAAEALGEVEVWRAERIEAALRAACEAEGMKPRVLFGPVRIAISGRTVAPGLFESLELLGRDESLARIDAARARVTA
jgi:glutamyl-tRNA synthetase